MYIFLHVVAFDRRVIALYSRNWSILQLWTVGSKLISKPANLRFSQTHTIGNIGINANFVFTYICTFLLYCHNIMLVNEKLQVSESKVITLQGCWLHWSISFLMVQLKRSWQYWHSCIADSLWKPLLSMLEQSNLIISIEM